MASSMRSSRSDEQVTLHRRIIRCQLWHDMARKAGIGDDGMKRVKYIIERPYLDGRQHVEWPA